MKIEKKKILEIAGKLMIPFRQGDSARQNAIGLSILLHVVVVAAIASFWATTVAIVPDDQPASIEFDLVTEQTTPAVASSQSSVPASSEEGKAGGKGGAKAAQNPGSREAVLMASLAGLTELRESLGFTTEHTTPDSSSAFSAIGGSVAPNTDLDALGKKYGAGDEGTGQGGFTVSVGGVCIRPGN